MDECFWHFKVIYQNAQVLNFVGFNIGGFIKVSNREITGINICLPIFSFNYLKLYDIYIYKPDNFIAD